MVLKKYIAAARRLYAAPSNDDIEIDVKPRTSRGEDCGGVWVQAWVWVRDEDVADTD